MSKLRNFSVMRVTRWRLAALLLAPARCPPGGVEALLVAARGDPEQDLIEHLDRHRIGAAELREAGQLRFSTRGGAQARTAESDPAPAERQLALAALRMQDSENDSRMRMSDAFFRRERAFWNERRRTNLLLVHYNDLKADLSAEMKRVAEFLDITTPDVIWPQLVEAASFESMKRDGGRLMMPQLDSLLDRGHQNFFYKGTNSRWRSVLTDPDVDL